MQWFFIHVKFANVIEPFPFIADQIDLHNSCINLSNIRILIEKYRKSIEMGHNWFRMSPLIWTKLLRLIYVAFFPMIKFPLYKNKISIVLNCLLLFAAFRGFWRWTLIQCWKLLQVHTFLRISAKKKEWFFLELFEWKILTLFEWKVLVRKEKMIADSTHTHSCNHRFYKWPNKSHLQFILYFIQLKCC